MKVRAPYPVSIITGSSKRIGAAIAQHFHKKNYNVVVHFNHSAEDAQNLVSGFNLIREDSAILVQGNLEEGGFYQSLIDASIHKWGRLDVLINSASLFHWAPFPNSSMDEWDKVMNINLKSCFFLSQAAAPHLKKEKGSIVNLSDAHVNFSPIGYSIYTISKGALNVLTTSLAKELAPDIRVNAVAPGIILPPVTNKPGPQSLGPVNLMGRMGTPQDIVNAVEFLVNNDFITGQIISVDGGVAGHRK